MGDVVPLDGHVPFLTYVVRSFVIATSTICLLALRRQSWSNHTPVIVGGVLDGAHRLAHKRHGRCCVVFVALSPTGLLNGLFQIKTVRATRRSSDRLPHMLRS